MEPRLAATVVLLRAADEGLQVLMIERPKHLRFMGGATVFPGGALEPADRDEGWESASTGLGSHTEPPDREALATRVCALREAFEEVGWLVAEGPAELLRPGDADDAKRFLDRCLELGLRLATDALVPAGRWITPLGSPLRFDARFFVAAADPGWEPRPDQRQVSACGWTTPVAALRRVGEGEAIMAPPTIQVLQKLSGFPDVGDALEGTEGGALAASEHLATRLSPLVQVVLAPNPGRMTGPGTNTYIVGADPAVVIDVAVPEAEYLEAVVATAGRVGCIMATHRHPDHVGGALSLAHRTGAPVRAFGPESAGGAQVRPLLDEERIQEGGATLTALHTPGHARDHVCFMLEQEASLFSGDNILGEGTSVIAPPEGNMRSYLDSLRRLRRARPERIYPGHFRPLAGGAEIIDRYLAHRAQRERAIMGALSTPSTPEQIVQSVYSDTPGELWGLARLSVLAHLEMLKAEARVTRRGERWSLAGLDESK
jgi:glyoxylase-like metal-dependent hydrolase (beta-lactamase superfamily II)/8-oxo-dGTP pyrophosphatase MutT (NUDIX family)